MTVYILLPNHTCMQCKFWMYYIGEAIFITTLIMKNWRIYRIFHNKQLRKIVSYIHSDKY